MFTTRKSRRTVLLGGAAAGAAALAACGTPSGGSESGSGAGKPPQEITWSIYGDATTRPAFEAIQSRFNEQKTGKYTANLALLPGSEYIDKTLAALAGDSPPDVFLTYAQYKPAWVKKNLLRDDGITADTWDREKAGIVIKREKLGQKRTG